MKSTRRMKPKQRSGATESNEFDENFWDPQPEWDQQHGWITTAVLGSYPKKRRVDEDEASQEEPQEPQKGKGKGKSKGKGMPRECWTCGNTEHYQRACPHNYQMPKTV